MKGYKRIYLDIMVRGRFFRQIPYEFPLLFAVDLDEVKQYALEKIPSLQGVSFNIEFSDQRIIR